MNQWAEMGLNLFEMLSPLILALLGWLGMKLSTLIRTKIKNEMIGGMLARLNDSVFTAVKSVEQTMVRQLKAAKDPESPGGTQITKEEGEQVKSAALAEIKSYWGPRGLSELGSVLGLESGGLDKLLESKVEAAVHDTKHGITTSEA